jgi:diacylglycerol kinase family enzyme
MTSELKQIKKSAKDLHRMQDEQEKTAIRVGELRNKLEKTSRKMQKLENTTVQQEQRLHELRNPEGQPGVQSSKGLRPARLIINANAGSFTSQVESPEKLVAMLHAHGIQAEIYLKTSSKALHSFVRKAVAKKEALIIAAGGDGTVEDVAFSLIGSHTALGIIPVGNMNNLARALGIPLDIEKACALLGAGLVRQIDVGHIRTADKTIKPYFLETVGVSVAISALDGEISKKGPGEEISANFRKMLYVNTSPVQIELDNSEKFETNLKLLTISNAPLNGLNNLIASDAKMDDGLLDLAIYDDLSDLELTKYLQSTANHKSATNSHVHFYHSHRIQIRSCPNIHDATEKDLISKDEKLTFEAVPSAISVIVGQGSGLKWPVAVSTIPDVAVPSTNDQPVKVSRKPVVDVKQAAPEIPASQPESLLINNKNNLVNLCSWPEKHS